MVLKKKLTYENGLAEIQENNGVYLVAVQGQDEESDRQYAKDLSELITDLVNAKVEEAKATNKKEVVYRSIDDFDKPVDRENIFQAPLPAIPAPDLVKAALMEIDQSELTSSLPSSAPPVDYGTTKFVGTPVE